MQYAPGTPPWARSPDEFEPALGSEAQEYLDAVIERYGPVVKYWELGNEMDHWRAADPQQSTDKLAGSGFAACIRSRRRLLAAGTGGVPGRGSRLHTRP